MYGWSVDAEMDGDDWLVFFQAVSATGPVHTQFAVDVELLGSDYKTPAAGELTVEDGIAIVGDDSTSLFAATAFTGLLGLRLAGEGAYHVKIYGFTTDTGERPGMMIATLNFAPAPAARKHKRPFAELEFFP